jgi:hypothetical protein
MVATTMASKPLQIVLVCCVLLFAYAFANGVLVFNASLVVAMIGALCLCLLLVLLFRPSVGSHTPLLPSTFERVHRGAHS